MRPAGTRGGAGGAASCPPPGSRASPLAIARSWGRIGVTGFGGPPAHIALLRQLVGGGLMAATIAFAPSFGFILLGGSRFDRLRRNATARAFLTGAGPAAIGAILGAAVLLAAAIREAWQWPLVAAALVATLVARRGVVGTLLICGAVGVVAVGAGAPVPR